MGCASSVTTIESQKIDKQLHKMDNLKLNSEDNNEKIQKDMTNNSLKTHSTSASTIDSKEYTPQNNFEGLNVNNGSLSHIEEEIASEEDNKFVEYIQKSLNEISQQLPKYVVTENYLIQRKQCRILRKENENPSPFISKNIKNSHIYRKRMSLRQIVIQDEQ